MNEKGLQQLDEFLLNCENISQEEREDIMEHTSYLTGTTMKLRELLDKFPILYEYDYKWKGGENSKDLNEILKIIGYKLVEDEVKAGDYNDIKGYFECEVEKL